MMNYTNIPMNMIKIAKRIFLLGTIILLSNISFSQDNQTFYVDVDKPKAEIQPTMWGVFFEDINFAADGGIYAELVKNRSFEFYRPKEGWRITVDDKDSSHFLILNRKEKNEANPRFARIKLDNDNSPLCLSNSGFRGMGIKKDNIYHFSCIASLTDNSNIKIRIELVDQAGNKIGETIVNPDTKDWKKYTADFPASVTGEKCRLNLWFEGKGQIDIDMISLFPDDTWKKRPGGLRADLVQLLADLKPGFLRFPGGCIVEGYDLNVRYQWKKTLGNPEDRTLIVNRWNTEFKHRPTPDYYQSFGLGFYEYFQLAEDIGASPLPVLNCGMACQFNSAELVPLDQLDPYIQDALDLIEFANGAENSEWGSIRTKMGHPASFNLKFLGIGNEQWGPQYFERYALFEKAIREKYPEIVLVSSTGPQPDGDLFDFANNALKGVKADIVDEHYYRPPSWFLQNASRYDTYDRNSFKIFAGEYAAQSVSTTSPLNRNNWECALSEAAFMTGLERNADVVVMCSYAPLFAHYEGWQWTPDLIWFDNLKAYGTANYQVQKLFSNNRGTHVLNILQNNEPVAGRDSLFATAAFDKQTGEVILKLVNASSTPKNPEIVLKTNHKIQSKAVNILLHHSDLHAMNSPENSTAIAPVPAEIAVRGKKIMPKLPAYSFSVVRIKIQ
jgi:alpha-N-arabinofuranosidase